MIGRPEDESTLSRKPSQIRNRLRRARKRAEATGDYSDMKYELSLLYEHTGWKPVEEWSIEELAMGRPRDKAGGFAGPAPKWITPEVTREVKRRLHSHAFGKLTLNVDLAVRTVVKLMISEEVDDKGKPLVDARTKLAAAQFVIEHVIGKPKEILEVDATDNVRKAFAAAIVLDDGRVDSHLQIEGTIVEEDTEAGD